MKARFSSAIAAVLGVLVTATAFPADFDCITLPADPTTRPPDCDANPDPIGWCSCLKSSFTALQGDQPAMIQQAIIYVRMEPTPGKYVLSVLDGTLDLSGLQEGDEIGTLLIDVPMGGAENFHILFSMLVTAVNANSVDFDIYVTETNATTEEVLTYHPLTDPIYSNGLVYHGQVVDLTAGNGFELTFEYPTDIPLDKDTGISKADLSSPNLNIPILLEFPAGNRYKVPPIGPLDVETTMTQMDILGEKTIPESFDVIPSTPKETFRRGDVDGDGEINISDPINFLTFQFLGGTAPMCRDAADSDDSGVLDLSDAVYNLSWQFLGGLEPPAPGPKACGEDPKADDLPACEYKSC
jgi:hypothetical protein